MISIGGRKVLLSETVLCPVDEAIELKVHIPNEEELWKLKIIFSEEKKDEKPKPYLNWNVKNDVWNLNFINWNNSLGATISTPVEIATSTDNGQPITFLAEVAKLSNLYRINFQLMMQEDENV